MTTWKFTFPRVGTDGFAFPFPYLCGQRGWLKQGTCWRRSHHFGAHRSPTGHVWGNSVSIDLVNPDSQDLDWGKGLSSLFRTETFRDMVDMMHRGHW